MKDTKISDLDPGELEDREQAGLRGRGVAHQYLHVCTWLSKKTYSTIISWSKGD